MHLHVITGGLHCPSLGFVIGPPCGCSFFELVCHKLNMLILKNISHIKELFNFIDPIQKGFDVKVSTEGRNLDLHPKLGFPLLLSGLGKKSSFPIGI